MCDLRHNIRIVEGYQYLIEVDEEGAFPYSSFFIFFFYLIQGNNI